MAALHIPPSVASSSGSLSPQACAPGWGTWPSAWPPLSSEGWSPSPESPTAQGGEREEGKRKKGSEVGKSKRHMSEYLIDGQTPTVVIWNVHHLVKSEKTKKGLANLMRCSKIRVRVQQQGWCFGHTFIRTIKSKLELQT